MIVFESEEEIIICEKKNEKKIKKEFFDKTTGRDIDDYDQYETSNLHIGFRFKTTFWEGLKCLKK